MSRARRMRAFYGPGGSALVVGLSAELAGVPRAELLSGARTAQELRRMVDSESERSDLYEVHDWLSWWSFGIGDAQRIDDIAEKVDQGQARAVLIQTTDIAPDLRATPQPEDQSYAARMEAVLGHVPDFLGDAAWDELRSTISLTSLAILLVSIVVAISSGVGALVVLGVGLIAVGWSIFDAIGKLVDFVTLFVVADTPGEQRRCAQLLAQVIAAIGVGAFLALITRGGARAARLRPRRVAAGGGAPPPPPPATRPRPARPEPAPARPPTPGERIAGRRAHHNRMVDDLREELEDAGHRVMDRSGRLHVPPGGPGNQAVPDLIVRGPDGRWRFYEVKTGAAELSPGQQAVYPRLGDAIPSDALARRMGIPAGQTLRQSLGYVPEVVSRTYPGAGL